MVETPRTRTHLNQRGEGELPPVVMTSGKDGRSRLAFVGAITARDGSKHAYGKDSMQEKGEVGGEPELQRPKGPVLEARRKAAKKAGKSRRMRGTSPKKVLCHVGYVKQRK